MPSVSGHQALSPTRQSLQEACAQAVAVFSRAGCILIATPSRTAAASTTPSAGKYAGECCFEQAGTPPHTRSPSLSIAHSLSSSLSLAHAFLALPHKFSHALSLTQALAYTRSRSIFLAHALTHPPSHTLPLTQPHILSNSSFLACTLPHYPQHTLSLTLPPTRPPRLSHCIHSRSCTLSRTLPSTRSP